MGPSLPLGDPNPTKVTVLAPTRVDAYDAPFALRGMKSHDLEKLRNWWGLAPLGPLWISMINIHEGQYVIVFSNMFRSESIMLIEFVWGICGVGSICILGNMI